MRFGESKMKLYLDDLRPCPKGWRVARTAARAVTLLMTGKVQVISLDHDLGDGPCGCFVMRFLRDVYEGVMPEISFHTANPIGRKEMQAIFKDIGR
jgi:hypothetical protein